MKRIETIKVLTVPEDTKLETVKTVEFFAVTEDAELQTVMTVLGGCGGGQHWHDCETGARPLSII